MSLNNFRSQFKGVKANRFQIIGKSPAAGNIQAFNIYARASSFPGSSIGVIPVGYKGRPIKFSGERTYTDWAVQVYDSSASNIRQLMENWIDSMDTRESHQINYDLTSDWEVHYMDMAIGTSTSTSPSNYQRKVKLVHCFPIDISPIDLSYDTSDTFAEFTLTLTYDYWEYI